VAPLPATAPAQPDAVVQPYMGVPAQPGSEPRTQSDSRKHEPVSHPGGGSQLHVAGLEQQVVPSVANAVAQPDAVEQPDVVVEQPAGSPPEIGSGVPQSDTR